MNVIALTKRLLILVAAACFTLGGEQAAASPENDCFGQVQGRIAWNYEGATRWSPANVRSLCRGTKRASQPGRCFDRVMHGGINWGGGTTWKWENALNLCRGTSNANATVSCFKGKIARGAKWAEAIDMCRNAGEQAADLPAATCPPASQAGATDVSGASPPSVVRRVSPEGQVELHYPDGTIRQKFPGGFTIIHPDGTRETALFQSAQPPTPPSAPPDATHAEWLTAENERLLGIIRELVGNDEPSIQQYLAHEGSDASPYDKVDTRTQAIEWLIGP
jgi:hypothetical protein